MRLARAVPETEGPRFVAPGKKIGKIRRIVNIGYSRGRWHELALVILLSGESALRAIGVLGYARPPAFAGKTGLIAGSLEHFGQGSELLRIAAPVVAGFLELPRIAARYHTCARRSGFGIARESIVE